MNGIKRQKLLYIDNNVVTIFSNVCIIIFVDNIRNRKRVHSASTKLRDLSFAGTRVHLLLRILSRRLHNESYGVSNYTQLV